MSLQLVSKLLAGRSTRQPVRFPTHVVQYKLIAWLMSQALIRTLSSFLSKWCAILVKQPRKGRLFLTLRRASPREVNPIVRMLEKSSWNAICSCSPQITADGILGLIACFFNLFQLSPSSAEVCITTVLIVGENSSIIHLKSVKIHPASFQRPSFSL